MTKHTDQELRGIASAQRHLRGLRGEGHHVNHALVDLLARAGEPS